MGKRNICALMCVLVVLGLVYHGHCQISAEGFPNVIGCVDGTQIKIATPRENEADYVNRKGFHSLNIQMICNNRYEVISMSAKWPGSTHDARIWRDCALRHQFENVLWTSCQTMICGPRKLILQCEKNFKININNVTSGRDALFDRRSYTNLQRTCMGMTVCDPAKVDFCKQHNNVQFTVNYTCINESVIENECESAGKLLKSRNGFISSPNYPSETTYRYCKWKIQVPPNYFVHIFIHEISSSISDQCDGLIFQSKNTCGKPFPTYAICDQPVRNTISACADTEVIQASANKYPVRFWLSYYVLPVSDIRYAASLYDVDLTCGVRHNDQFVYSEYYNRTVLVPEQTEVIENVTAVAGTKDGKDEDSNYAMYVALGVGLVILIIILLVVAIVYLRYRLIKRDDCKSISGSTSQNNVSDIQKRPLPERHDSTDLIKQDDDLVLQQGYSVVADEVPSEMTSTNMTSPTYATYAEIEELSEGGEKPKTKLMAKRSIDSSKRQLPEKPDEEPLSKRYYDIEVKDIDTEKKKTATGGDSSSSVGVDVDNKNKKNVERKYPNFFYKKKVSNPSNIYAECADIMSAEKEKTYMDMSHKKLYESDYVPHGKTGESVKSKYSKDKVNQSKRSLAKGPNATYAECSDVRKSGEPAKGGNKSKNESVTSDSDSDDDISMVENELYEPFESAKV